MSSAAEDLQVDPKSSLKEKFKSIRNIVTVEPLIALYQMAQSLSQPALDNLEFEKSCRVNLNYSDDVCTPILRGDHTNHTLENAQIQVLISNMHSWQRPLQSFMPLVLSLFLGSFSDRLKRRKPFILLPLVGDLLGTLGCMLCVIFMNTWPLEAQGVSQKVVPSLFGGQTMLIMSTTTYIADISTVKMRTLRLGIVQIVLSVFSPLVNSFSGVLFTEIGYIGILSISAVLYATSFCYGLLWIRESGGEKFRLVHVFDLSHARDTFNLILKKTPGNNRGDILVVIAVIFIYRCAFDGETNLWYLYTQNVFQWTPVEYSYFVTVNGLVTLVGNSLGVPLFTRILKWSDHMILLVTILNKIASNIIFGLAKSTTVLYTGLFVSIVSKVYKVGKRSITTKVVSENDTGKAQSLIAIFDVLAPALSVPVYNKLVYVNTLLIYPSAFFFFSIIFYGLCCVLLLCTYCRERKKQTGNPDDAMKSNSDIIESIHM